jgi:cysteine-rich repeat protein
LLHLLHGLVDRSIAVVVDTVSISCDGVQAGGLRRGFASNRTSPAAQSRSGQRGYCRPRSILQSATRNSATCNIDSGDGCSSICIVEFCGDGIVNNGEFCEDGNNLGFDGCFPGCLDEFVWHFSGTALGGVIVMTIDGKFKFASTEGGDSAEDTAQWVSIQLISESVPADFSGPRWRSAER